MGAANHDVVAAAKGAISSLALSAASTYSAHNIRVNCVAPGLIRRETVCTAPTHAQCAQHPHESYYFGGRQVHA